MKKVAVCFIVLMLAAFVSGCIRSYVFEKERVDQEISGNRGVLMGAVPDMPRKEGVAKRTVIGVDIDIPDLEYLKRACQASKKKEPVVDRELWGNKGVVSSKEASQETKAFPYRAKRAESVSVVEEESPARPQEEVYFIEYKVQKGDTLSSIAAKPEIYKSARKWKKIYEANADTIKDPARLYPGQVLKIPMSGKEEISTKNIK